MTPQKEDILSNESKVQKKALETIYAYCLPRLVVYMGKQREGHLEAGDILQDAMAIAYQNLKTGVFEGQSSINTYVLSICKKLWLYKQRSESRFLKTDLKNDLLVSEEKDTIIHLNLLNKVTSSLSLNCQSLLKKVYFERISMDDIAKELKLGSSQAVRNKKWRCLKGLMAIIASSKLDREDFYL